MPDFTNNDNRGGIVVTVKKFLDKVFIKIQGPSGNTAEVNASNELKVSAAIPGPVPLPTGSATAANQVLQIAQETAIAGKDFATQTTLAALNTKVTTCNTGAIAGSVTANAGTNLNTSALALETGGHLEETADHVHSIDGKITACNTGAVAGTVAVSNMIPAVETGLATSALQLPDGHNVTVDNAAGAGVYVQPGTSTSWNGLQLNELVPAAYDYVDCVNGAYGPTSVVFKTGGAGGTTVATLTIAYDGTTGFVDTVTRT